MRVSPVPRARRVIAPSLQRIQTMPDHAFGRCDAHHEMSVSEVNEMLRLALCLTGARLAPYRGRVVSTATGRVLEISIGSGLNDPFYGRNVNQVFGLEPSPKLLDMALKATRQIQIPLRLIEGTAEAIAIEDRNIDTVVTTWTMSASPTSNAPYRRCAGY